MGKLRTVTTEKSDPKSGVGFCPCCPATMAMYLWNRKTRSDQWRRCGVVAGLFPMVLHVLIWAICAAGAGAQVGNPVELVSYLACTGIRTGVTFVTPL